MTTPTTASISAEELLEILQASGLENFPKNVVELNEVMEKAGTTGGKLLSGFVECGEWLDTDMGQRAVTAEDGEYSAIAGWQAAWQIQQKIIDKQAQRLRLAEITLRMEELNALDEFSDEDHEEMEMLIKEGLCIVDAMQYNTMQKTRGIYVV